MELPIETQIEVLKRAKENYIKYRVYGLCFHIEAAIFITLNINERVYCKLKYCIPIFTYENAVKHSKAYGDKDNYWWQLRNKNSRIKFLDWMIYELEKEGNKK
jgi:hypothetical protein